MRKREWLGHMGVYACLSVRTNLGTLMMMRRRVPGSVSGSQCHKGVSSVLSLSVTVCGSSGSCGGRMPGSAVASTPMDGFFSMDFNLRGSGWVSGSSSIRGFFGGATPVAGAPLPSPAPAPTSGTSGSCTSRACRVPL